MYLIQTLLVFRLISVYSFKVCNQQVLNSFSLNGMKTSYYTWMKVCPNVLDTCCSIQDEIKIYSFWNNITKPKIVKRHQIFVNQLLMITEQLKKLQKLDYTNIQYRYIHKSTDSFQFPTNISFNEDRYISPLNSYIGGYLVPDKNQVNYKGYVTLIGWFPSWEYFWCIISVHHWNYEQVYCAQMQIYGWDHRKWHWAFNRFIMNSQLFDFTYYCVDWGIIKFENGEAKVDLNASVPDWSHINYCEFLKRQLQQWWLFDSHNMFREIYYQYKEGVKNHNIMNNIKSNPQELKEFQQKVFKENLKKPDPYWPYFNYSMFNMNLRKNKQKEYTNDARMSYVLVNQQKYKFCQAAFLQFKKFDFQAFINKIYGLWSKMSNFKSYRGNLYCNLCDANHQQYFSTQKNAIVLSWKFCSKMINENKGLLYFLNITLIDFLDFVLNFMKCYESTQAQSIIKQSQLLQKQLMRKGSIKWCLEQDTNLRDYYEKCWFLCDSLKWDGFSDVLEGDMNSAGKVLSKLISFFRKREKQNKEIFPQIDKEMELNYPQYLKKLKKDAYISSGIYFSNFNEKDSMFKYIFGFIKNQEQILPQQIDYLTYIFIKNGMKQGILFLQELLIERNKLLQQITPQTAEYLRNYSYYIELNKKLDDYLVEIQTYEKSENKRILRLNEMQFNNQELKDSQMDLVQKIKNLNQRILNQVAELQKNMSSQKKKNNKQSDRGAKKSKERILEEHKTNEPVYDEGLSGYSAQSMKVIYEEQGIDLSNRDWQLESVSTFKDLIMIRLKSWQALKKSVVQLYIQTAGQTVNQFNRVYLLKPIGVDEMVSRTRQYETYIKKSKKETDPVKRQEYIDQAQQIAAMFQNQAQWQWDQELVEQLILQEKIAYQKRVNQKLTQNEEKMEHHVLQNFNGMLYSFISIFGV